MNRSVTPDQPIPSTRLTVSTVWEIWWVAHCTSVQLGKSTWENYNEGGGSPGCVQQPTRGVADGHGQRLDLRQWACLVRVRGVQEVSKDTCKINLTSKWYSRYVAKQGFLDLTAHDYQLVFGVEVKSLLPRWESHPLFSSCPTSTRSKLGWTRRQGWCLGTAWWLTPWCSLAATWRAAPSPGLYIIMHLLYWETSWSLN